MEENNVTGRLEPKEAPAWQRRAFRYLVSFPVIGLCLCVVFAVMFLMLRFQVSTYHTDGLNTLARQSRGHNVAACEGISILILLAGNLHDYHTTRIINIVLHFMTINSPLPCLCVCVCVRGSL